MYNFPVPPGEASRNTYDESGAWAAMTASAATKTHTNFCIMVSMSLGCERNASGALFIFSQADVLVAIADS
jgi:hypothetical protein